MDGPQIIETPPRVDVARWTLALAALGVISWQGIHWRLGLCTLTGLEK